MDTNHQQTHSPVCDLNTQAAGTTAAIAIAPPPSFRSIELVFQRMHSGIRFGNSIASWINCSDSSNPLKLGSASSSAASAVAGHVEFSKR